MASKAAPAKAEKTKANIGARRRMRLFAFALVAFLAWAGIIAWNQQEHLDAKTASVQELELKLQQTAEQHEDYEKEVRRLNDPEYILQKIRKELHYTKPGETLFYTPKSP